MAKKRHDIEQTLQHFTVSAPPDALHDLRVALRRLQSLLRSISHNSEEPLRQLIKSTNRARDLEVFIRIARCLTPPLIGQKKNWQQQLEKETHNLQHQLPTAWQAVTAKLPDTFDEEKDIRHLAAKQLHHEIGRLKRRRKQLCHHWDNRAAHKLRISGKHIRYLLEPFALPGSPTEQCIDTLKSFQDLLGEYNDRATLLNNLEKMDEVKNTAHILKREMQELRDKFINHHCQTTNNALDTFLHQAQQQLGQT